MGSFSAQEYFYKVDNMLLSSCQLLRKVFEIRYKEKMGKDYEHTEEQGKAFLESQDGEKVLKNAKNFQKKIIGKGCLEEWDMSTLSMVLHHFGDQNLYRMENEAVRQLTKLRNELAHHPTKKLSREDYNTKVDLFRENLRVLREESCEIDKIIEKAGKTSSVAAREATKKLLVKAEMHMKAEEFEKAVLCFDEATTMPSLLPVHEGAVYEKRAECYLNQGNYLKQKSMRSDGDNCIKQAMLDATLALQLNDSSWKAHVLIAQCHRWNTYYERAIQHYNKALALSPTQTHVKKESDSCKVLANARERNDYTDPCNTPPTLTEMLAEFEEETGRKLSGEQWITLMKDNKIPGQEDAVQGCQYLNGWLIPQNFEEAVRYFSKATEVGNIEGIFGLACCYSKGHGIKQDLQKAYDLFHQVATMAPEYQDDVVVRAQYQLALMFHDGICVEQDYSEAAKWFEKAVENGSRSAAYNLAIMYANEEGVPKNYKKTELLYKQGVILKDPNAAEKLMNYYIFHMEPEKARAMFETGKDLGNRELIAMSEDEFSKMVQSSISDRAPGKMDRKELEADVVYFERKHKLNIKGMTFFERYQRQVIGNDSKLEKIMKNIQNAGNNDSWARQLRLQDTAYETMKKSINEGSITAQNVMETATNAVLLANFVTKNDCETDAEKNYALELLYKCCTGEFRVANSVWLHDNPIKNKLKMLIRQLFNTKCGEKGEEDMKIRLSYVCFCSFLPEKSPDTFWFEILKEGMKMYPNNMHYYELLTRLYAINDDPKSGLEWCEKGLQNMATNVNLLYVKAALLQQLYLLNKVSNDELHFRKVVAACNQFLTHASSDHRHVPSVYYSIIVSMHTKEIRRDTRDGDYGLREMEHYFNKGQEAERKMLACYLPCDESEKRAAEMILMMAKAEVSSSGDYSILMLLLQPAPKSILERKQYLSSSVRKKLVLHHRNHQNDLVLTVEKFKKQFQVVKTKVITASPKLIQTAPRKMSRLKPITLSEMNPTYDNILKDRVIDFTIIDDPVFGYPSIHLIAEDENGDVARLYIYNVEQNKEAAMNLAHGSTIAIMNPYMRIGSLDGKNSIRNDEPSCLIYLEKVDKMCRFCGEENAQQKCSRCKKACYCSRECQELDWKLLKHKIICSRQ